jgi:hypothetical protein
MIPPDEEIYQVEQRIALRRSQVARYAREAGTRAMQRLASPWALGAAGLIGFLAASAIAKREQKPPHPERRKEDHTKAAKATGLAGMLIPVGMWLVRAQWGSPVAAAQVLLEKMSRKKAPASPRGDAPRDTRRLARP